LSLAITSRPGTVTAIYSAAAQNGFPISARGAARAALGADGCSLAPHPNDRYAGEDVRFGQAHTKIFRR
jgi:hypothetical protein